MGSTSEMLFGFASVDDAKAISINCIHQLPRTRTNMLSSTLRKTGSLQSRIAQTVRSFTEIRESADPAKTVVVVDGCRLPFALQVRRKVYMVVLGNAKEQDRRSLGRSCARRKTPGYGKIGRR